MDPKPIKITGIIPHTDNSFELVLSDIYIMLTPPKSAGMDGFDPFKYYITSGDAIQKTTKLYKDIYLYAGIARRARKKHKSHEVTLFEGQCWKMAGRVSSLLSSLKKLKQDAVFLETERLGNGRLMVFKKWPRVKKDEDFVDREG